jgi:hypothetical protein
MHAALLVDRAADTGAIAGQDVPEFQELRVLAWTEVKSILLFRRQPAARRGPTKLRRQEMREIYRVISTAIVLALPFVAAAQGTNAFDGTYRGVSLTVAKNNGNNPYREGRCPPPAPTPPTLRIAHGEVHAGAFHGTVSPEGVLRMNTDKAFVVEGRIEC